jgi:capsular exopolysaccharide synthesis family protein
MPPGAPHIGDPLPTMPTDLPVTPEGSPERTVHSLVAPAVVVGPRGRGLGRAPAEELEWRSYLRSVLRHKRVVAVAVGLGLVAGVVAALRLKPTYGARANIWVEEPREGDKSPGPTWSSELVGTAVIDLLRSDLVLAEAVREQRLYVHPKSRDDADVFAGFGVKAEFRPGTYRLKVDDTGRSFTLSNRRGTVKQGGTVGDSVASSLGFAWVPSPAALTAGRSVEFEVVSLHDATLQLLADLKVHPGPYRSPFIRIELRGPDPAAVTATVNAVAKGLVNVARDLKRQKLTALTGILGEQLEQAQAGMSRAEGVLKGFRARTATLLAQERDPQPAATDFLARRVDQEQLRNDRELIERVLATTDSGPWIHALEMIGAVQRAPDVAKALQDLTTKEAELRVLRQHYTDAHPAVRRLAGEVANLERVTIRSRAQALVRDLALREGRVARQVDSASQGLRRISPLSVEEARLARDVTVAERLFLNLRERYDEARLAEVSVTPDVRLLDTATEPDRPLYSLAPLAILVALVGSFGMGVVGAVLLDVVDPKVRYAAQVGRELGLTVLGVVPHVSRRDGKGPVGPAQVIEALRGVRLNVLHAHGAAGPLLLTITSPGMRDGKSFVSANLALAFADAGYRTLLIDGDIRRGTLHRVLNAARKPGLTDLLAGEAPQETVLQATAYPGLSFIACGARRHRGPELLASAAMARLVTGLRASYDVMLVDSSPLAAGVDPYALGTLTGNLLLVLRPGGTDRQFAEAKLEELDRLPIRVLGTVVNDVRPGADYKNYSYYLVGYESEEEPADGAGRRILGGGTNGGERFRYGRRG